MQQPIHGLAVLAAKHPPVSEAQVLLNLSGLAPRFHSAPYLHMQLFQDGVKD
jgi:hypothetical protein